MLKVDKLSFDFAIKQLQQTSISERAAALVALKRAGAVLHEAAKQNISLKDHNQKQLTAMGHPYARRHGSVRIHAGPTSTITDGSHAIHTQSGRLLRSLKSGILKGKQPGFRVFFDARHARYTKFVIKGTRTMLPRDVLGATLMAPMVQDKMRRAIILALGKELGAKSAVRF